MSVKCSIEIDLEGLNTPSSPPCRTKTGPLENIISLVCSQISSSSREMLHGILALLLITALLLHLEYYHLSQ